MKARIDVGSDAAMIGAWDASRNERPMTEADDQRAIMEEDAAAGHLFLLETHADGGGPADVYVDEPIEAPARERLREVPGSLLLRVPTGSLMVGGGEDYRSASAINTSDRSVVRIPPGDYEVRCFVPSDSEREPASEDDLRRKVGADELAYYDRTNRTGCIVGAALLLAFPILLIPFSWKVALPATIVIFLAWFPIRERLLKRNQRYQKLDAVVPTFRLQTADPYLVITLQRTSASDLRGGIASL